ncbi:MAG: protein translocase subunit SecD [Actinobacteria bacterium]|nr:protein translocase subunit SecD [Actinomycetota bacterium]
MDRKLWTRLIFILFLLALAFYYVLPWGDKLKGGIDLVGGTSLLYEIDTSGLDDTYGAAEDVVKVLRRRVDPDNVRNLIWRTVGNTRIEILMPLPSQRNREISQNYNQAIEKLEAGNISLATVHNVLQMSAGSQRQRAWQELLQKYPDYQVRLASYQQVYERTAQALKAYMASPDSVKAKAAWGVASLEMARARKHLLDVDVTRQSLEAVLGLKGQFPTPIFVAESTDFPDAYDDQIARLKENGPQTEQRQAQGETYLWLGAEDLRQFVDVKAGQDDSDVIEALRLEMQKTGHNPVLAQNPQDGKTYVLAYASRGRRAVGLERMLSEHPSRREEISRLVHLYDEWSSIGGELDDPETLKRLLRGQGVLEFRILPRGDPKSDTRLADEIRRLNDKGPELAQRKARAGAGEDYAWFRLHDPETFREGMQRESNKDRNPVIAECKQDGQTYVLAYLRPDKAMVLERDSSGAKTWQLTRASVGRDDYGGPAVLFDFDPRGSRKFEQLTRDNIGQLLAVLLDDSVYSAPNIREAIRGSGRITGNYTQEEARQLANIINAGSLMTKLQPEPIREYNIGATMGQENRDRGARAAVYALIAVAVFMVVYYLFAGVVANVALFMNLILVLAIMAGVSATFTLPGIAGLILTVGMSVDANVLIFERIREEHREGASLRLSIRNGYRKVFWTIFDANVTTLITALILYWVGSEQVRGFAITLGYGICMSMFTSLFVTRTIFDILVQKGWLKNLPMLRLIKRPSVNWMAKRRTFYAISAVLVIGGIILFIGRSSGVIAPQRNLYDIEFAGGTSVWFRLTEPASDGQIRQAIAKAGEELGDEQIISANIYAINPKGKERQSRDFKLDTSQTKRAKVEAAIERAFADKNGPQLQERKPVEFTLLTDSRHPAGLVPVLEEDVLVGTSPVDLKLVDYIGGLKLTLMNLTEPQRLEDLQQRIRATRLSPEFSGLQYRKFEVLGLKKAPPSAADGTGDDLYSSVAVVVVDPAYEYSSSTADIWKSEFAYPELRLLKQSLSQASRFQGITKFNPEVAAEAKTKAGLAIVLALFAIVAYVWVRFGKGRYGLAAILALAHDVFAVLGLVALATFIYRTPLGRLLGVSDLKIDMTMIAAILTIIGYSLNDTIVVFDRIRENRGRLADISPGIVNSSINQTISRTVLTSLTTLLAVLIMYIWGGPGIHGFTSAMILGVIIGTYSSIAIASPSVLLIGRLWQKWSNRSQARASAKQAASPGRK